MESWKNTKMNKDERFAEKDWEKRLKIDRYERLRKKYENGGDS